MINLFFLFIYELLSGKNNSKFIKKLFTENLVTRSKECNDCNYLIWLVVSFSDVPCEGIF